MRATVATLLLCGLLTTTAAPTIAEESSYPPGQSTHRIEGLKVVLVVPESLSAEAPASLLIVLHGAGGSATGMAGSFAAWAGDDYVVCAPKAQDLTWEPDDLKRTLRIAAHLKEALPIDPGRVHVVGFSNGGWNLHPLAFDDELRPCSATWVAAGFAGAQVPRWAKEGLAAIALAGSLDPNVRAARDTVPALRGKVRSVEVRVQPGLDHAFPRDLMPYLRWWMGVQDGRIVPGDDQSFEWTEDLPAAVASLEGAKKGGVMVWAYAKDDGGKEEARLLQQGVFFDPEIRFLGRQLRCVKLDRAAHGAVFTELGVETTPAIVVLDRKGKVKKRYEGEIKPRKLARTLRGVAPKRRMPEPD